MHFHESQGSCVWWSRRRDLELWSDSDLLNIYFVFNKYLSHICKKNYNNTIKTTFGPPLLPIKHPHKTPPLTNLRGVRTPLPSTLDPRMHFKISVFIGKWKDNGPPLNQSCDALQLNITRSVIFQLYIFSESTPIHDIASAGFESATFWLQVTYMLDIQRNWQSKLSNVPLSINWVYIILIILFKKNCSAFLLHVLFSHLCYKWDCIFMY